MALHGTKLPAIQPLPYAKELDRFLRYILQHEHWLEHYLHQHSDPRTMLELTPEQLRAVLHLASEPRIHCISEEFAQVIGLSKDDFERLIHQAKRRIVDSATNRYKAHQEELESQHQDLDSIQEDEVSGFTTKTKRILFRANIDYLVAFTELTEADVRGMRGIEQRRFDEIKRVVEAHGYSFKKG